MFRLLLIILFLTGFSLIAKAQNTAVSFKELDVLQAKDTRPVVVLIMTSWCKYCHAMKNSMLYNKKVAQILEDKFRTVFLNAEEKNDLFFSGRTFKYRSGANDLARELGTIKGQLSYPTLCILNERNEIIYQHDGYLPPNALAYTFKKVLER